MLKYTAGPLPGTALCSGADPGDPFSGMFFVFSWWGPCTRPACGSIAAFHHHIQPENTCPPLRGKTQNTQKLSTSCDHSPTYNFQKDSREKKTDEILSRHNIAHKQPVKLPGCTAENRPNPNKKSPAYRYRGSCSAGQKLHKADGRSRSLSRIGHNTRPSSRCTVAPPGNGIPTGCPYPPAISITYPYTNR